MTESTLPPGLPVSARLEAAIAESPIPVFAFSTGGSLLFMTAEKRDGLIRHFASEPDLEEVQTSPTTAVRRHLEAAIRHWSAEDRIRAVLATIEARAKRQHDAAHGRRFTR